MSDAGLLKHRAGSIATNVDAIDGAAVIDDLDLGEHVDGIREHLTAIEAALDEAYPDADLDHPFGSEDDG